MLMKQRANTSRTPIFERASEISSVILGLEGNPQKADTLRSMKIFLSHLLLLVVVIFPASMTCALSPPIPTLEENVKISKRVFVGIAKKITVRALTAQEKRASGFFPAFKGSSSRKVPPPLPPMLWRSITVDVQIIEILKSGKRKVPRKFSVSMIRAFLSEQYMKEDIAEMKRNLINRKQIYLDFSSDSFRTESPNEILKIKGLLRDKRGLKANSRTEQTLRPEEQAPVLLNRNHPAKQRLFGIT
jgi:hypothetical protein